MTKYQHAITAKLLAIKKSSYKQQNRQGSIDLPTLV
jgi:hypothetical protein